MVANDKDCERFAPTLMLERGQAALDLRHVGHQYYSFLCPPSQQLAIPMVGHSYFKKTRFDLHISKILQDEQVSPKDFFFKEMQEISAEGGFRTASVLCTGFSTSQNTVSFTLQRGSFATMVMREIMKPNDPLGAGF